MSIGNRKLNKQGYPTHEMSGGGYSMKCAGAGRLLLFFDVMMAILKAFSEEKLFKNKVQLKNTTCIYFWFQVNKKN